MSEKKGFDLDEFGGNFDAVLVQSNADAVMKNVGHQECKQLDGNAWTVLSGGEDVAKKLSTDLGADAIYFGFGDASGWMIYHFFQKGEKVESYGFGGDYSAEMEETGAEYTSPWDIEASDGETQWGFSGKLRKVSEEEIKKGEAFIDEFFKSREAYLGWEALPVD
jgi:hypothetical protein